MAKLSDAETVTAIVERASQGAYVSLSQGEVRTIVTLAAREVETGGEHADGARGLLVTAATKAGVRYDS